MDRTIAVSDLDEQLPAADSQVKSTAGKSGLAQGGLPHTRCCSSALARSREGLCLIRPSQDGQGLGRSASLTVVGARQASAAPAVIKRVSTPGQSRGIQIINVGLDQYSACERSSDRTYLRCPLQRRKPEP
jgi:hypothetical protein